MMGMKNSGYTFVNNFPFKANMSLTRSLATVTLAFLMVLFASEGTVVARSGHPSFAQVEDVPGLPRVLLIGDSISMHYTVPVRKLLEGTANVHRPACNCRSTRQTLAELDNYLGEGHWDVISFNWGIHDLTCKNEAGKASAPPEGKHQVPLDEYRQNLQTLVQRLKRTGARLIWVSTTPVGRLAEAKGYRQDSDVRAYNAVAANVMKTEGVIINDLYIVIKPQAESLLRDGVHFNQEGIAVTAENVAGAIQKSLNASSTATQPAKKSAISPYSNKEAWQLAVPKAYQNRPALAPAFAFVEADPKLPNVLIMGGSNSMYYTVGVRNNLEGIANVFRAPDNCRSTRHTLKDIEIFLGDVRWDVICFNWGMHDLTCKNEAGKAAAPPEGKHQVPLDEYRQNLQTLAHRLKRTEAKLIWATTLPVGSRHESKGFRRDSDVVVYNAAAAEIMKSEGVTVSDLYTLVKPRAEELLSNDGIHFAAEGRAVLAEAVAKKILEELKIQKQRRTRKKAAHRKRRLIFDNDGGDVQFLAEPTRQAFLAKRISPLVGTHVDTMLYCTRSSGFGFFTYNTKVGEIFTCTEGRFKDNKTGYFIEQGTDALKMVAEFCKENNIELFWSMRMNDTHDAFDDLGLPQLKKDHPEWIMDPNRSRLKKGRWSAVDYGVKEIRDLAYQYCREVCENYDVNGIHLDFFRHPLFFRDQTKGKNVGQDDRDLMTELLSRIRTMTEQVGMQKGKPILVSVRVPDSVGYCNAIGLDIERWMKEGLIDIMVASGYCRLNPWEITVELGHKYAVQVYACLSESRHRDELAKQVRASSQCYRARAMNAWHGGVDGICLFNIFNPKRDIWNELGDPKTLAALDKVYTTGGRVAVYAGAYLAGGRKFLNRQLVSPETPLPLKPGKPETVELIVGENVRKNIAAGNIPDIELDIRLNVQNDKSAGMKILTVKINGKEICDGKMQAEMFKYRIEPNMLNQGKNSFQITLDPKSKATVKIDDIQLWLRYGK